MNDLLDLSRLEQGRASLSMEIVDLREVVKASVAATSTLFASKSQHLAIQASEGHYDVRGDRARLEQLLINLLSNAHKYTPSGSAIQARTLRSDAECLVTVRDNGPRVPPDEREKIFDRFYRSTHHRADRTSSTGLDLPIARKVVEMHGGRIWVEPAHEGGSIFTLALSVASA